MSNLTITLVRHTDGSIDEAGSTRAFSAALAKHVAERETEVATIAAAVNGVFDRYLGASINMPALASMALQSLNVQPENFKALELRCLEYVRENAQGDKAEDGTVANPSSTFVIGKGKGGGVTRRCDRPAKAE